MAAVRDFTVLEVQGGRLLAACAEVGDARVTVTRWHAASMPSDVHSDNAQAVGAWIASELRHADLPITRLVLSVPRSDVILKQLVIPVPASGDLEDEELGGVVHLQMVRQLTLSMDATAVDYLSGHRTPDGLSVLAAAMPADKIAWWKQACDAAGSKVRRIGLRCFGMAAVLAELSQRKGGPVLGASLNASSAEFVVVEDGRLVYARAADLARPPEGEDWSAFSERVTVEARRSWLAYRSAGGSGPEAVAVFGTGEREASVAQQCAGVLECFPETVGGGAGIVIPEFVPAAEHAGLLPLLGLLYEEALAKPVVNLASPKRAPDRAAKKRQRVLAAVLGAILLCGAAYVVADSRLGSMRAELARLQTQEKELKGEVTQYVVEHARISALEAWHKGRADWVAHLKYLSDTLPDPHVSTVDELSGRLQVSTAYVPKSGYPDGRWTIDQSATFELAGKMDDRQVVSDLRDAILQDAFYVVESRGADNPQRYQIRLISDKAVPERAGKPAPAKGDAPKEGAK